MAATVVGVVLVRFEKVGWAICSIFWSGIGILWVISMFTVVEMVYTIYKENAWKKGRKRASQPSIEKMTNFGGFQFQMNR